MLWCLIISKDQLFLAKPISSLTVLPFKKIITVEEHSEIGGLGSIISEKISKNGLKATLKTISLPDNFGPTGNYKYLIDYHGLTGEKIAKQILKSL